MKTAVYHVMVIICKVVEIVDLLIEIRNTGAEDPLYEDDMQRLQELFSLYHKQNS